MTNPTGSDPDQPPGRAPQDQPGWSATPEPGSPPPGYGETPSYGPPAGYGAAPAYGSAPGYEGSPDPTVKRPAQVTAAAIIGIVWGALGALVYMLATLGAFTFGAPFVGLMFLVATALLVALIVGGAKALQGRSPRQLLLLSYVAIALSLLSLVVSLISSGEVLSAVLGLLVPSLIVFLIMQPQSRQYYASRGISY
jgi:hypothetical protein